MGVFEADPSQSCSCVPGVQEFPITDPALLAAWTPGGSNTIGFSKDAGDTGVAWVKVRLEFSNLIDTRCLFDFDGDRMVGILDLLRLIAGWDSCFADIGELLGLLAAWGPCQ